tara:strand:- start:830 stop:2065 length:1236 start_codon:yes stop_codon:yes gene_type:complete
MVKNKLPNVLVLTTTFPRWENDSEPAFVYNLSKRLAVGGFNITVLAPGAPDAKSYEVMDRLKVYRFSYFYPKKFQKVCYDGGALPNLKSSWFAILELPFFLLFQFLHIGWIIKKEKIDMIHCHWIVPQGFFSSIFKKIYNIPLFLTAHAGDVFLVLNNPLLMPFGKFAVSQSELCIANSKATEKATLAIANGSTPVKIIPMGVDLDVFNGQNQDKNIKKKYNIDGPMLLAAGRFVEKKGFKYLIKAMPLILKKYFETKLIIIGFGPLEKSLKDMVAKLNISDSVIFPGKMSSADLAKYFAVSDVFIGPSIVDDSGDTEGLGVVFLEALASNTAVVASRVGGITDFIVDRETGLLVEQEDPEDLAQKIMRLLGDRKLREKIAYKGKKYVEDNFSWGKISEQYLSVYKEVLNI